MFQELRLGPVKADRIDQTFQAQARHAPEVLEGFDHPKNLAAGRRRGPVQSAGAQDRGHQDLERIFGRAWIRSTMGVRFFSIPVSGYA